MKSRKRVLALIIVLCTFILTSCGKKVEYFEEMENLPMPTNYEHWVLDYKDTSYEDFIDYYFTFDTESVPEMTGMLREYYNTVEELGFEVKDVPNSVNKYIISGDTHCTTGYKELDGTIYFMMCFSK